MTDYVEAVPVWNAREICDKENRTSRFRRLFSLVLAVYAFLANFTVIFLLLLFSGFPCMHFA